MKKLFTLFCLLTFVLSFSQDKPAYQLFDKNGKRTSYKKLLKASVNTDILLFGEHHDNPISHWLQLALTKDIHKQHKSVVMGAEMLERDNQEQLNQYLLMRSIKKDSIVSQDCGVTTKLTISLWLIMLKKTRFRLLQPISLDALRVWFIEEDLNP